MATKGTGNQFSIKTLMDLVAKMCKSMSTSSTGLLEPVIQTLNAMESFAKTMDEAGRELSLGVNPIVSMAIEDLKVQYHAVFGKARLYVRACKDMASYVCESNVLEDVERDLEERNSTAELSDFLDEMKDYLLRCKYSLGQFNTIQTNFGGEVKRNSDQWDGEAKKHAEQEKKGLLLSRGSGIVAGAMGVGGVALGLAATSIVCPPAVIALAAVAVVTCTGAAVSGGLAGAFAVERGISREKKEVFVEAAKRTVEFYRALTDLEVKIGAMGTNLEAVRGYIGGVSRNENDAPGLTEMVERASSGGGLRIRKIKAHLDELRDAMQDTLKEAREFLK